MKATIKQQAEPAQENPFAQEPRPSTSWIMQAVTGAALVLLLGLHFIANHFVVQEGLRDFADVVSYLRTPIILVLEILFMVVVTSHALMGVRAILLDFGLPARAERTVSRALTFIGLLTVGYSLWLTWMVIH